MVTRGALTGQTLGSFGYSLFIPDKLRPRDRKATDASLLQELPIATQGGNTLFQRRLEELAASHDWKVNWCLFCESFPQGAQALASGEMAVILPDLARLGMSFDSVWVYPLNSLNELRREVVLAWHPHRLEPPPSDARHRQTRGGLEVQDVTSRHTGRWCASSFQQRPCGVERDGRLIAPFGKSVEGGNLPSSRQLAGRDDALNLKPPSSIGSGNPQV